MRFITSPFGRLTVGTCRHCVALLSNQGVYVTNTALCALPPQTPYLNAMQINARHLLRYLCVAVIINKRRRSVLRDLVSWLAGWLAGSARALVVNVCAATMLIWCNAWLFTQVHSKMVHRKSGR